MQTSPSPTARSALARPIMHSRLACAKARSLPALAIGQRANMHLAGYSNAPLPPPAPLPASSSPTHPIHFPPVLYPPLCCLPATSPPPYS